jgi:hypothetical protein
VLRRLGELIDQYGIVKLADGKYQIKNKIVYMKIMGEGVYGNLFLFYKDLCYSTRWWWIRQIRTMVTNLLQGSQS